MPACKLISAQGALPRLAAFLLLLLVGLVLDQPVRVALEDAPTWLRDIGEAVTWVGNSNWMFTILLAVFTLATPLAGLSGQDRVRRQARLALRVAVALFLLILLSGIAVQILKHLLARARPDHFDTLGAYAFHPLSFTFRHASFPSGHATTVAALAVFIASVLPRLWPVALAMATTVAVSRVLVLKHYPSDIIAGLALGAVCACLLIAAWRRTGLLPPDPVRLVPALTPRHNGRRSAPPGLMGGLRVLGAAFGKGFRGLGALRLRQPHR